MAHVIDNLLLETCTAALSSSEDILLAGTLPGYREFSAKCADNDTVHYLIREVDAVGRPTGLWEMGRGTFRVITGSNYIQRTTVIDSSSAGAPVTFGAGTKYVSMAQLAPTVEQVRYDQLAALGMDMVGMVGMFPYSGTVPTGWMKANGAAVSRTTYARLFSRLSTTYGAGDGTTTFNLPDYRGYFPRFYDDGRGVDSGRVISTVQAGQVLAHNHGITDPGHAHGVNDPAHAHSVYDAGHQHGVGYRGTSGGTGGYVDSANASSSGYAVTDAAGTGIAIYAAATGISIYAAGTGISTQNAGGAENRPANMALMPFVKF